MECKRDLWEPVFTLLCFSLFLCTLPLQIFHWADPPWCHAKPRAYYSPAAIQPIYTHQGYREWNVANSGRSQVLQKFRWKREMILMWNVKVLISTLWLYSCFLLVREPGETSCTCMTHVILYILLKMIYFFTLFFVFTLLQGSITLWHKWS